MATTIQNIELPKKPRARDTSGNNNHGQIYSGRGLEFDGVTDYLDGGTNPSLAFGNNDHTLTGWFNTSDMSGTGYNYIVSIGNNAAGKQSGIGFQGTSGQLFLSAYASPLVETTARPVKANIWYRLVMVYTGGGTNTADFYLNGVFIEQESIALDVLVGKLKVGVNLGNTINFAGMISDVQVWDKAWTATDVAYDYLNPESLALNASGSALTESNLKLWYPMQDGHRGQQSYILDGANTGAGDEMVTNGDFSDGSTGWTTNNTSAGTHEVTFDSKGARFLAGATDTVMTLTSSAVVETGKNYRLEVVVSNYNGSSGVKIDSGLLSSTLTFTGNGTHVYQVSTTSSGQLITFYRNGSNVDLVIESVSLKPINDKHHATTVFYGDELGPQGTFVDGDLTGWTLKSSASNTTDGTSDYADITTSASSNNAIETTSSFTTVVGRTYRVFFDRISGTQLMACYVNDSASTISAYSLTAGSYTLDFVATSTAHKIGFRGAGINHRIKLDNVSVKEVGVASGWTDADQQLHIPQTALQSYNELAWFDGVGDYVTIADHDDLSFDAFSVSAWINMNDATNFPVISKGSYNSTAEFLFLTEGADKLKLYIMDESVSNCYIGRATAALTSSESEWLHVVGTYDGGTASSGVKLYINGVQSDDANAESNPGSFVAMENLGAAVTIGKYNSHYANGCITETSLWDKELSSTEVLELFNDGKALDALTHSASSDIKGYWRNNGLSTWTDLSTNSNNGTPTSVTETILIPEGVDATRDSQGFLMNKKRSTGSLNLDGVGYASLPTMAVTTDDFTFEAWAKAESNITHESVIMEVGASMLLFGNNHGYIRAVDGTFTNQLPTHSFVLGNWYHIVVTRIRNGNQIMYVDGVAKNTVTAPDTAMTLSDTTIGKDNTTRTSSDVLDAVKVYSAALSATEVLQNYNATKRDHKN